MTNKGNNLELMFGKEPLTSNDVLLNERYYYERYYYERCVNTNPILQQQFPFPFELFNHEFVSIYIYL